MQVAARIGDVVGDKTQEGSFADEQFVSGEQGILSRQM